MRTSKLFSFPRVPLRAALLPAALLLASCSREGSGPGQYSLIEPTAAAPRVSTGTFKAGDLLEQVFRSVPYADVAALEKALKKAGAAYIKPEDVYAVAFSTSGQFEAFALARGEDVYRVRRATGSFSSEKSPMPVSVSEKESSGEISSSLWDAMSAAGIPPAVIMEFADVFAWKIDFLTEPRKGDRFALVWEERATALGSPCGIRIKAAAYKGSETGEERGYYHSGSYYDAEGASLRRAFLRAPLSYRRISSHFTKARFHPILRIYRPHNGIDYSAPSGTPVSAVADGSVVFKGRKGGYGNFIEIRHGGSYSSGYGHLRGFAKGVRSGGRVKQGQVIAYVGSTGISTGPHLDFRFRVNGRFKDFLKFRPPASESLKDAELAAFREAVKPLAERLNKFIPAQASGAEGKS